MVSTSILIPSRNEKYLNATVSDLLAKARGDIEIVVVLDGYWEAPIADHRVRYIHRGEPRGMRAGINAAAAIARGEFLLKCDAHTLWDEGFDVKLAADCGPDWVVIPRRKRLDAENWCVQDVGKPDVDYEYLSFPEDPADFGGPGLNGRKWDARSVERRDDPACLIDDTPASQGSAWFMRKDYFERLGLMDDASWGPFWCESQELAFRSVLTGGRYVVNKKTHYAHLHKGKTHGRGYAMSADWLAHGRNQAMRFFAGEKVWPDQKYPLSHLIERFMPMPGWTPKRLEELKAREAAHWGAPDIAPVRPAVPPDTLRHVIDRFGLTDLNRSPVEIPDADRVTLAELFREFGFGRCVEVGTERGHYAEALCRANPGMILTCVDPWLAYRGYREHVSQAKLDGFYEETKERLNPYGAEIVRKASVEAAKDVPDGSLDAVYIDANHSLPHVVADLCAWVPKVRKGGIVAGHDYVRRKNPASQAHVVQAVHAFTDAYGIKPLFVLGRRERVEGERRDRSRSWFFVVP